MIAKTDIFVCFIAKDTYFDHNWTLTKRFQKFLARKVDLSLVLKVAKNCSKIASSESVIYLFHYEVTVRLYNY